MSEGQLGAIAGARKALARALDRHYPRRLACIRTCVTLAQRFSDLVVGSIGRADLVAIINEAIARGAGLQLVPVARN